MKHNQKTLEKVRLAHEVNLRSAGALYHYVRLNLSLHMQSTLTVFS